jgi:Fe-Mn family superoxide dismutase
MKGHSIMMTRRQALKTATLSAVIWMAAPLRSAVLAQSAPSAGPFTVPPLGYPFDALEPYIDALTMQIHHDKHHAAYVANLNKALADYPDLANKSAEELVKALDAIPDPVRAAVRNNGGGHFNHSLFWQMMKKEGGGEPSGELSQAIDKRFKSFAAFREQLTKAAVGQFGSGWAWLVLKNKELAIESSANQDSPLSRGAVPLLGVDVWEHAYYLKYQNRRADYVAAWFKVINWDFVSERFAKSREA